MGVNSFMQLQLWGLSELVLRNSGGEDGDPLDIKCFERYSDRAEEDPVNIHLAPFELLVFDPICQAASHSE